MMKRGTGAGFVTLLFLLLVAAPPLAAQQDAGIIGQVTDESGGVLPGVTITATSIMPPRIAEFSVSYTF